MRSDLIVSLQKYVRGELAALRRLGAGRRDASRRMPTLTRSGPESSPSSPAEPPAMPTPAVREGAS